MEACANHLYAARLSDGIRGGGVRPVFVVGSGRSGTSILCNALNNHTRILFAPGESPMLHALGLVASDYRSGGAYCRESTAIAGEDLTTAVRSLCIDCVWGDALETTSARMEASISEASAPKNWPIQVWGAKAFPNEESTCGLCCLFPQVRFVYVFRNGIDVVYSMSKFHGFRHMSFRERCIFWAERVERFDFLRRHDLAIAIRFEDFLEEPARALASIISHIGLVYEDGPAQLAATRMLHPLDQQTLAASARSVLSMRPPAYESFSTEERHVFRDLCCERMLTLGYEIPF